MIRKMTEVGNDRMFSIRLYYADDSAEEFGFVQGLEDDWWQGDYDSWVFNMLEEVTKYISSNPEELNWTLAIISFFDYNADGIEVHRIYVEQENPHLIHEVTQLND